MVIEHFKSGKTGDVYERYVEKGRMLPAGLNYIDSWLAADRSKCYQLMNTENPELFSIWIQNWEDLIDFEIVEVVASPTKQLSENFPFNREKS